MFRSDAWRALLAFILLVSLALLAAWPRPAAADPAQGPGGPILVLTSGNADFGKYYAEILRNEGLNAFTVADVSTLTPALLASHDLVLLAKTPLSATQVTTLSDWVTAGGNLIAMAPDGQLAGLLGLTPLGSSFSDGYLLVDSGTAVGNGIVNQTIQFHGAAKLHALAGASSLATLYGTATSPTSSPAVTLRQVGAGRAASFAFDLATSIVYTRQGNPAWSAQERDGFSPIRSNDKFFGAAAGDPQPDWIDRGKVSIPQADEQQRLLANLIVQMNLARKPLPRFWYFPRGKKAVIVMTGDDHANAGTIARFNQFKALSPNGCSVANWECVRGTSYIYHNTAITNEQAAQFEAEGFEVGLHVNTQCADYDLNSLTGFYTQQVADFKAKYTSLAPLSTQRHHCIAFTDWSSGPQVQFAFGMRLDTNYYFWPPSWVNNTPGLFNGTAMPMRFMKLDGSFIDVYLAPTQMTDESGQVYPFTVDTLLDGALGPNGYYGAYVINAHTDADTSAEADAAVASAQARGVSVISARQLLNWVDARNGSSFSSIGWNGSTLGFTLTPAPGANGLHAMLPARSANGMLASLTRSGNPVTFSTVAVKGVEYAFFAGDGGNYVATYTNDASAPAVTATTPPAGATNVSATTAVTASFGEAMDPASIHSTSFELRNAGNAVVGATVAYDAASRTATLSPSSPLAASSSYTATLRGGAADPRVKDAAGNPLAANLSWSFSTSATPPPTCPCSGWNTSTTTPTNPSVADPNPVELGVKFRADVNGYVTGVRFYKGTGNTGTHIGSLWTVGGALLASATFVNETATGWQTVTFSSPVPISANTVYVASYFAPNGNYAADSSFFAAKGVDNPPIHLLQSGVSGNNGVYSYSPTSVFPSSSFQSTNYWVDVVFTTDGPADTTAPAVTAVAPSHGSTNVGTTSPVTATFSEAIDPSTLTSTTFQLRDAANVAVPATIAYNPTTRVATLSPNAALAGTTLHTATLRGGAADPRIKDLAGNPLATSLVWSFTTGASGGSCAAPPNEIVAENCLPGSPPSEWDIAGIGDATLQGFATQLSINRGSTVSFKVKTDAAGYRFDIYRLGWYGGQGARKVATVLPTATLPQSQPACLGDSATGLIDCGNWAVSGSWAVPATAVSGIYVARLVRNDTGGASHIVFVVRNDAGTSDVLFQTADTTWQAYNNYGGNSLYTGLPVGRAYKVSYNRPFNTRIVENGQDWLFNAEYPMLRWLEANGYDVSYFTGIDTDRFGSLLLNHKLFLSVGHDEYWSGQQRANVEAARNAGVNLAFFSGNEVFWKTRWESSIDGSGTTHRTLVCYKETHAGAKIDPNPAWTGTWRDPRFSPPSDGSRPENSLTGTLFMVNDGATTSIRVPAADGKLRLWRNTSVATLAPNTFATFPLGTLGYEWDVDADNGTRPPGLMRLSTTVVTGAPVLTDHGSTFGSGTATHSLTLYKHSGGARVFGAGTVQWSWGLDATHDRAGAPADLRMQQATVNLFADMNVQPSTLQAGLFAASPSSDAAAPVSAITSPASGSSVPPGSVTLTGTASDSGGGVVGGVEVSIDGGTTWRPATGRANWTFTWTPSANGSVTVKSRAVDDSGNLEVPGPGITINVAPQACPCTIWPASAVPNDASDPDTAAVNLGVKFRAAVDGTITGIRFYKGSANTGTHVGTLWTLGGTQLATVTFTNETASGWQQMSFASPVAVTANTVYVASYHAPNGRYAGDNGYFSASGIDNPPLHALQNGVNGGNGVYAYGPGTAFPTSTFQASNYWVDVVFVPGSAGDTTAPTVGTRTPAAGATGVSTATTVNATFSESMDPASISGTTFELRDAANALVPAGVGYNAGTQTATLTPTGPLTAGATYTATVRGGTTDPRVKDLAGNPMAANATWSFTTLAADTTPPTVTTTSPAGGAAGVAGTANVTATFSEAMDAATIGVSTFELRDATTGNLVAAAVSYNATTRVATLNPTPTLSPNRTYTATVRGGAAEPTVRDAAGNPMAATFTWSFTVFGETVPPTITSTSPAAGATGVGATANVTATFNEAMDATTINTGSFELRDDTTGTAVAGAVSYNTTTRVATFNPTPTLVEGRSYTATVRGADSATPVRDASSNALATSLAWSFTIATSPPTVTTNSPANGATGVAGTANMTVTFSEAMLASTINTTTVQLRDAANALVPGTVGYNTSTRVATFNPTPTLVQAATYTLTVRGGTVDPRVTDLIGLSLASDHVFSFTIAPDVTAPTVTATVPAAEASSVSRTANITATFSERMNPATITTDTVELRTSSGTLVPAVVTYTDSNRRATLNPNATLAPLTSYTVTVRGGATDPRVKDVAGNALADHRVWTFTTRP